MVNRSLGIERSRHWEAQSIHFLYPETTITSQPQPQPSPLVLFASAFKAPFLPPFLSLSSQHLVSQSKSRGACRSRRSCFSNPCHRQRRLFLFFQTRNLASRSPLSVFHNNQSLSSLCSLLVHRTVFSSFSPLDIFQI